MPHLPLPHQARALPAGIPAETVDLTILRNSKQHVSEGCVMMSRVVLRTTVKHVLCRFLCATSVQMANILTTTLQIAFAISASVKKAACITPTDLT